MSETSLTIGELAARTGVPAKTIRYYESIGLLPAPERSRNGYRRYAEGAVAVLVFVRRSRSLGFSIDEVEELLQLWRDKGRASREVRDIAKGHIAAIEQKVAELESIRRTLAHLVDRCHGDDRPDCPILDGLTEGLDELGAPEGAPSRKKGRRP
ncbi:MAG: Cu(I)-responsive transcriptional regulator [Myxococcales bacterium]|nr:Cu(I)-responsive transcriptional regulator [Myxococcales bacterium]